MYPKIVEIDVLGLLGAYDLRWPVGEGVNILSGGNGSGKSTLLRGIAYKLRNELPDPQCGQLMAGLEIRMSGGAVSVITNFDERDGDDFSFDGVEDGRKALFFDIIDRLFHHSGKHFKRAHGAGGVVFLLGAIEIPFAALSSGERQILRLFYDLLRSPEVNVLILDEPEISLQIEWQKVLLQDILRLNPSLQILVATHSPAIVMNGWVDRVSEISGLVVNPQG